MTFRPLKMESFILGLNFKKMLPVAENRKFKDSMLLQWMAS